MMILPTTPAHGPAIEAMLDDAFGPDRHNRTAYMLRRGQEPADGLSFVVMDGPVLCGSISLWHVRLDDTPALLLGPIAVAESCRGKGLGAALITHALKAAQSSGHDIVMLVGDAPYYGRFGFSNDSTARWSLPGPVDQSRVLALSLHQSLLPDACAVRPPQPVGLAQPAKRKCA